MAVEATLGWGWGVESISIYRAVLIKCQEPGIDGACGEEAGLSGGSEKMGSWEVLGEEGFRNKEVLGRAPGQDTAHRCASEGDCWPWGGREVGRLGGQELERLG